MEILLVKNAGFCFGVKRAVDLTFKVAEDESLPAVALGPIIHNPQVIEELGKRGIATVDKVPDNNSIIIIRTHGIEQNLYGNILKSGHRIIDATCPFVKKAQQYAKLLSEEDYQVLILGDSNHPEVKGILSYAGGNASVINSSSNLPILGRKVGIVVQTTQLQEALKALISNIVGKVSELKVFNTICNSTALRLKETEKMARKVNLMLVVGGKNSANTTQLAHLCKSLGVTTYHIETASEIKKSWIRGINKIGITAGASTPDWIIEDIKDKLRHIGG
ncbi:4-hydroxy-3-methylbut-2-enyl diphosphate reductase [bacterium BMS3Abin07]|nr:4-hydroxy-3-methylbut-2-enyl diphosphate reductase [bacterium BMS3Abin07]GBE33236.1 4-hydroxy-3-methylbut-2-enyl diphosphate reductase [bacterium BMS3Bbin05]HDO21689.1 4-hydroxy-3-methylbut-2-enyl diphosphate reductase [Nitrospirota bacterium]HDZ87183.1 4-hydroxy-3-methylbut-2-enyl diphosphate reductase [Nitrospirota bacterium]